MYTILKKNLKKITKCTQAKFETEIVIMSKMACNNENVSIPTPCVLRSSLLRPPLQPPFTTYP